MTAMMDQYNNILQGLIKDSEMKHQESHRAGSAAGFDASLNRTQMESNENFMLSHNHLEKKVSPGNPLKRKLSLSPNFGSNSSSPMSQSPAMKMKGNLSRIYIDFFTPLPLSQWCLVFIRLNHTIGIPIALFTLQFYLNVYLNVFVGVHRKHSIVMWRG